MPLYRKPGAGGGIVDMFGLPVANNTFTGITLPAMHAADIAGLNQWAAVFLSPGGPTWQPAQASEGSMPARGLLTAAYPEDSTHAVEVLVHGIVRNDAWTLTPGSNIYISGSAGGLTHVEPGSGTVRQIVGYALTADIAYFHFNAETLLIA